MAELVGQTSRKEGVTQGRTYLWRDSLESLLSTVLCEV